MKRFVLFFPLLLVFAFVSVGCDNDEDDCYLVEFHSSYPTNIGQIIECPSGAEIPKGAHITITSLPDDAKIGDYISLRILSAQSPYDWCPAWTMDLIPYWKCETELCK